MFKNGSLLSPTRRRTRLQPRGPQATEPLEVREMLTAQTEGVLYERFDGIVGNNISALTSNDQYPESPDSVQIVENFDSPFKVGNNYGVRMRGYITAPETGEYTFWIAADNHGSLLLSDSDDPTDAEQIASVEGWTWRRQWSKYESQQSAPISLVAGQQYYIEALMKESSGGDHLVVAWSGPGASGPAVIESQHLTVFQEGNHTPVATGDTFSVDEDSASVSLDLLANDINPFGSALQIDSFTQPAGGNVTVGADGKLLYTPDSNFFGSDHFNYTVMNELGLSATATVELDVTQTQGLLAETFHGIGGRALANLTNHESYPLSPSQTEFVNDFRISRHVGNNYGVRVRGYLTAPTTGEYTFYITADDRGSLRLSDDHQAAGAVEIASTDAWTGAAQWAKYASQQSVAISLIAGKKYFIEALMKEGSGGDHLSVAWSGPGVDAPTIIAAEFLTRYDTSLDAPGVVDVTAEILSGSEARVTWAIPPSLPDSGYEVLASTDGGVNYEVVATTNENANVAIVSGLTPDTAYQFQVRATTDETSDNNPIAASSPAAATPDSSGQEVVYRVNLLTGIQKGDAGYSGTANLTVDDESVTASSASAAIYAAVSGSTTITDFNDNTMDFDFNESAAYNVSAAASWKGASVLPSNWTIDDYLDYVGVDVELEDAYIITLEDSFGWKTIDADYNDFFWVASVHSNNAPEFTGASAGTHEEEPDVFHFSEYNWANPSGFARVFEAFDQDDTDLTFDSDDVPYPFELTEDGVLQISDSAPAQPMLGSAGEVMAFTVAVRDSHGAEDTATVYYTIDGIPSDFDAQDDMVTLFFNPAQTTSVMIDVMENDSPDANPDDGIENRRIVDVSTPENGTATVVRIVVPDGSDRFEISYTPTDSDFRGSDTFTYRLEDYARSNPDQYSNWAQVTVEVLDNALPIAYADDFFVTANQVDIGTIVASDPGDTLYFSIADATGPLAIDNTGKITSTGELTTGHVYSFNVVVSDLDMEVKVAVTVSVKPDAQSRTVNGSQLNWITGIDLTAGDNSDGADIDVEIVGGLTTANGVLFHEGDGVYKWIPKEDWYGTDTFDFKLNANGLESQGTITISTAATDLGSWQFGDSDPQTPPIIAETAPGAVGDIEQVTDPHAGFDTAESATWRLLYGVMNAYIQDYLDDGLADPPDTEGWAAGMLDVWNLFIEEMIDDSQPANTTADEKILLLHFLGNTGEAIDDFPVDELVHNTPQARTDYTTQMAAAISLVSSWEFVGTIHLTETTARLGQSAGGPFSLGVGNYTTWGDISVTGSLNADGTIKYEFAYTYNFWDPYDWNPNKDDIKARTFADMHLHGKAKQFMMTGEMTKSTSWSNNQNPPPPFE